jgi:ATP-dependent DNA helicase DinG
VIEVEVHQQLCHLLKHNPEIRWPHQLTMARMVARGLRLQRSALIQVLDSHCHRLSYLLPALMWDGPTLLCAPREVQENILRHEIPWLQQALNLNKPVLQTEQWPGQSFTGLILMDPVVWLQHRLRPSSLFPTNVPILIDGAEKLEDWIQDVLTVTLSSGDWYHLQRSVPHLATQVEQIQIQLTRTLLQHSLSTFLLDPEEYAPLFQLLQSLPSRNLPRNWFAWQQQARDPALVLWATILQDSGQIILKAASLPLASQVSSLWSTQPFVLIGEALDLDREATAFRYRLGLPDLTPLRFGSPPSLPLYLPSLPAPNHPLFRAAVLRELIELICGLVGRIVILVSDQPLQTQLGTSLAAEFGSRVRVNLPSLQERGILVCSWYYWLLHQDRLPSPDMIVIVTLPFPSREDPWVAAQINYLQQQHQDWFRLYLLPLAAAYLQRGTSSLRSDRGVLAILDNRIMTRSYGIQLLDSLGSITRISRQYLHSLDPDALAP